MYAANGFFSKSSCRKLQKTLVGCNDYVLMFMGNSARDVSTYVSCYTNGKTLKIKKNLFTGGTADKSFS
ncbi:hypothetical protein Y032_0047g1449 [Ancylostoma ceylanicum]|uniref:Uncharacterized protein n=1 Tax=Ancylostoma ceylanicum TaxID=53326 RepID=A0A016UB28_9BILA|nr:hypothetical protein Y032_0047g1449 [Ancylostoma ceylanicum]